MMQSYTGQLHRWSRPRVLWHNNQKRPQIFQQFSSTEIINIKYPHQMLGWQHWKSFSKQDKPKPKLQNKLCKSSAWTSDGRTLPEQPPILSWLLFAQLKAFGRWNQITVWYSNIVMEHKQFLKGKHSAAIGVGTLWESPQVFYWTHRCMVERLIDWLIDWLSDWLIDWLTDWLPEWLTEWMRPNCRHLVPRTQWWFSAIAWVSVGYISVVWGCLGCTFINYHRLWCQGIGMRSSPIGSKVFVDLATRLRRSKTKFARQIFGYLYIIFMTYNHPYVVCTNTKLSPANLPAYHSYHKPNFGPLKHPAAVGHVGSRGFTSTTNNGWKTLANLRYPKKNNSWG